MSSSNSAGKIVFTSTRDGNEEIYIMDADGSRQINLTNNPARDSTPAWSPDGARIAFFTNRRNMGCDLFVMDSNGDNPHLVVNISDRDLPRCFNLWWIDNNTKPKWSPDGDRFIFAMDRDSNSGISIVNADGSGLRTIGGLSADAWAPSWLPDGSGIVAEDGGDILRIGFDGSEAVNLSSNPESDDEYPQVAPDGSRVAFYSLDLVPGVPVALAVAYRNGVYQFRNYLADDWNLKPVLDHYIASWSPDGSQIAFADNETLLLVSADGTNYREVNGVRRPDYRDAIHTISWSPDGSQIAYDTFSMITWFADGTRWTYDTISHNTTQIYMINVDGSRLRQLTTVGDNYAPDWSPILPDGATPAAIPPVFFPSATPPAPTALDTPAAPTATLETSTAWLSGVAYPYATDCTGGVCPSCGQVDVYAVDAVTGAYYHTFVDGKPCLYSIEVPAPGTYTVAALTRQGQICGTYLTPDELERLGYGYCGRICEPSQVSVLPGDALDDLNIPLYLGPNEWPRGLTCIFIPVDTPPDLVTVTVENPNCVPYDLRVADRVITVPPNQSVAFDVPAGTYRANQCYADTTNCLEPQTYVWERDSQISLQWLGRDCWETDSSPFQLWVEAVEGCKVTVNGVTFDPSTQGPWSWNWGDGSIQTGWFPQVHAYTSAGEYMVEVTATRGELPAWTRIFAHVGRCP